jgi:ankyrin repeat protein
MQPQSHHFLSWLELWASSHPLCPLGFSPLHAAACGGLTEYAIKLLKIGHDPNCKDFVERTPLSYACALGHCQIVSLLLGCSANPNLDDKHGLYPIHYAGISGQLGVMRILIAAGVDPLTSKVKEYPLRPVGFQPSTIGETALFYSCKFGYKENTVELIKTIDPEYIS